MTVHFEMLLSGRVLVMDLIVMLVAGNGLGLNGGEHFSRALMQLTGLTTLDLACMCSLSCGDGGVVCIVGEGGSECAF